MKSGYAVMVLIEIENEIVQKVARVYSDKKAAEKYLGELEAAMKAGTRRDLKAVWLQENVRIY